MCGNVVYGESTSESSYQSSSDDEEIDQEDDKLHVNHIQCEGVLTIDEISVGNEAVQINHFNISDTPARIKRVRAENSGTQVNTF
jgi:exo-beta-1,3-glucanase (GH17 family)